MNLNRMKDKEGKYLFAYLGWVNGFYLVWFFNRNQFVGILFFVTLIFAAYKCIRHILKFKEKKNPIIVLAGSILIPLIFALISALFF